MSKPTTAQINKLPVWAREHVKEMERQRDVAVSTLNKFVEEQTPSGVFTQDSPCTGEQAGPVEKRRYLQTKRVYFRLPRTPEDFELEVYVNEAKQRVEVRTPRSYPYIEPQGNNLFYIIPKESMLVPSANLVLGAMHEADKLSHDDFTSKYGFSKAALPSIIAKVIGAPE